MPPPKIQTCIDCGKRMPDGAPKRCAKCLAKFMFAQQYQAAQQVTQQTTFVCSQCKLTKALKDESVWQAGVCDNCYNKQSQGWYSQQYWAYQQAQQAQKYRFQFSGWKNLYYDDLYNEPKPTISDFTWCPYCDESPPHFIEIKHLVTKQVLFPPLEIWCQDCNIRLVIDISELFPMNKVEMIWKPDLGAYQVRFPFDKTMIEFLKSKIPSGYRTPDYDDNGKFCAWLIDKDYAEALLDVLKIKFGNAQFTVITKEKVDEYNQGAFLQVQSDPNVSLRVFVELLQKAAIVGTNGNTPDFKAMTLLEATKLYRKAAMYYHPDRNPQLAKEMSSLNKAWTELKGAYWK